MIISNVDGLARHSLMYLAFQVNSIDEEEDLMSLYNGHASILRSIFSLFDSQPRLLQRIRETPCLREATVAVKVTSDCAVQPSILAYRPR